MYNHTKYELNLSVRGCRKYSLKDFDIKLFFVNATAANAEARVSAIAIPVRPYRPAKYEHLWSFFFFFFFLFR